MTKSRRAAFISSTMFSLATLSLVATADAQPYGPGMMSRGGFNGVCSPAAAGFVEWRNARLEQVVKTDAQRAKFDEFKAASNKAAESMRDACRTNAPATLLGRLDAMEKRTDALLQAIKTVRPALEAFYATLEGEQKARLDSNGGGGRFWRWRDRW